MVIGSTALLPRRVKVIDDIIGFLRSAIELPLTIIHAVTDQDTVLILQPEIIAFFIPAYATELGFTACREYKHFISPR